MTDNLIGKLMCLFRGHSWCGGYVACFNGYSADVRFCGRCCSERSFVE